MQNLTKAQFDAVIKKLKKDGKLTASGILAEASNPKSPLHSLFEWDDKKAAREYRLQQARQLIKKANIHITEDKEKIVHIPVIRGEGEYREAQTVVHIPSEFEAAMSEALRRLTSAELAVKILREVAAKESPDSAAILSVALQGLQTANEAIKHLH